MGLRKPKIDQGKSLAEMTADATAGAGEILKGYSAYSQGVKVEGNMEAIIPSKLKYQLLELDLNRNQTYIHTTNGKPVMVVLYGCLFCSDGTVIIPPSSAYEKVTVTFADAKITIYNGSSGSISKAKFYIYNE